MSLRGILIDQRLIDSFELTTRARLKGPPDDHMKDDRNTFVKNLKPGDLLLVNEDFIVPFPDRIDDTIGILVSIEKGEHGFHLVILNSIGRVVKYAEYPIYAAAGRVYNEPDE